MNTEKTAVNDGILSNVFDGLDEIFTTLHKNKNVDVNIIQSAEQYMAIGFTLLSTALQEHNIRHTLQ
jgi:hypothetical protein